jgi:hypothetical protein
MPIRKTQNSLRHGLKALSKEFLSRWKMKNLVEIKMMKLVSEKRPDTRLQLRVSTGRLLGFVMLVASMSIPALAEQAGDAKQSVSGIPFRYQSYANAVGLRLRMPGKERITAAGKLARYSGDQEQTEAVTVTWEFPLKIRLDLPNEVLAFDGANSKQIVPEDSKGAETIQVLLEDTLEGFLAFGGRRGSSRDMRSGYRLLDAKPEDSCMDIVHVVYPEAFRKGQTVEKAYWFNCQTKLLGVVTYPSLSGGRVHIVVEDWRDIEGEKVPFRIERWEEGKLMLRLTLDEAVVSAGAEDGAFGGK